MAQPCLFYLHAIFLVARLYLSRTAGLTAANASSAAACEEIGASSGRTAAQARGQGGGARREMRWKTHSKVVGHARNGCETHKDR